MSAPGQVGRVPEKKTLGDDPVQIEAFCANARRNRSSVKVGTDHNRVVTDPVQDYAGGASTSRSDPPPPYYEDLCAQMSMLATGQQRLHDDITSLRHDFDAQRAIDNQRWTAAAAYVQWMTAMYPDYPFHPPPPPQ